MRKHVTIFFLTLLSVLSIEINAQQINQVDIDNLSDKQIQAYWQRVQEQGYTLEQIEIYAKSQGMSSVQVMKLKNRINNLKSSSTTKKTQKTEAEETEQLLELFGLTGKEPKEMKKDSLYGYDFFNNPNISFTPNINVATPKNYILGAGDEVLIDLWGATEANYIKKINKQGVINLEGIGQIHLNGLTIKQATSKINSYLKRIYSGIGASKGSYNKVYTAVSLKSVRTVQINIIGEVKAPGTYSLSSLSNVLNALYASGGPTKNGTFRNVKLFRNGTLLGTFDVYEFLINGSQEGNFTVQDQDIISVEPFINLVTIDGQVKRPGIYELKKSETVKNLLTYCGGFTPNAYTKKIVVERVNGREKEVKEIKYSNFGLETLKGGDKITINKIIDKYLNRISIDGAVYRPGNYEFKEKLTAKDLINKADGITKEAFLDRAILTRTHDETNKETISFSLKNSFSEAENIALQPEDSLYIFRKDEVREKQYVTINGAVNKPQQFDFTEGMQVEDLIAMAGGLTESADANFIEVSRRLKDGNFETLSEKFNLSANSLGDKKNKFTLKPFDIVSVRYLKGYTPQKNVTVKGEVNFPGNYSLINKNERISDLLSRAGGITKYAYIEGASLIRKLKDAQDKKQTEQLEEIAEKDSLDVQKKEILDSEFKIGINLSKVMTEKGKNSKYDLILEEGDELFIPSERQTIRVQGEVMSPSLVRYEKGKSLADYVNQSGGFSSQAKRNGVYVVYANGNTRGTSNFLFFKTYPKLTPGAVIYVPKREERKRLSTQEIIGITTGVATVAVLINTLVQQNKK